MAILGGEMATRWLPNVPWPDAEVEKLKQWRAEGLTNTEIGKRLHRSRSAVQAKAEKMNLPSAYKRVPPQQLQRREPEVKRAGAVTLPPLASLKDTP
jgi:hypothetical protein